MDKNKIFLYMSRWAFHGGAPGLGLFSFDTQTGELEFLRHLNETISLDPTYLDEEKKILYICNEANLVRKPGMTPDGCLLTVSIRKMAVWKNCSARIPTAHFLTM